jgi:hypothetical protein
MWVSTSNANVPSIIESDFIHEINKNYTEQLISLAKKKNLAFEEQWLNLLHYKKSGSAVMKVK